MCRRQEKRTYRVTPISHRYVRVLSRAPLLDESRTQAENQSRAIVTVHILPAAHRDRLRGERQRKKKEPICRSQNNIHKEPRVRSPHREELPPTSGAPPPPPPPPPPRSSDLLDLAAAVRTAGHVAAVAGAIADAGRGQEHAATDGHGRPHDGAAGSVLAARHQQVRRHQQLRTVTGFRPESPCK